MCDADEPVREWRFYLGIDNDMLWSIIQTDIPGLLLDLHRLKDSLKTEDFSLRSK